MFIEPNPTKLNSTSSGKNLTEATKGCAQSSIRAIITILLFVPSCVSQIPPLGWVKFQTLSQTKIAGEYYDESCHGDSKNTQYVHIE